MSDTVFLIAKLPDPTTLPHYGLAWWDMEFVRVNNKPTPFKSREEAENYMEVWDQAARGFAVYELKKVADAPRD